MPFEPIRRLLPRAMQQAGIQKQVTAVQVVEIAQKTLVAFLGTERASLIRVAGFVAGELKLETTSSSASQYLRVESIRIQNELNRAIGRKEVQRISCRLMTHGTMLT